MVSTIYFQKRFSLSGTYGDILKTRENMFCAFNYDKLEEKNFKDFLQVVQRRSIYLIKYIIYSIMLILLQFIKIDCIKNVLTI